MRLEDVCPKGPEGSYMPKPIGHYNFAMTIFADTTHHRRTYSIHVFGELRKYQLKRGTTLHDWGRPVWTPEGTVYATRWELELLTKGRLDWEHLWQRCDRSYKKLSKLNRSQRIPTFEDQQELTSILLAALHELQASTPPPERLKTGTEFVDNEIG